MKNKCLLRSHNDLTPVEDLLVHNVTYIPGFIMLHNAFIKTNNDMPSMYCLINVPSKLTGSQLQLCMCPVLIGLLKEILDWPWTDFCTLHIVTPIIFRQFFHANSFPVSSAYCYSRSHISHIMPYLLKQGLC